MTPEQLQSIQLPEHIGIIMDGNGRWAKQRGLSRSEGHRAGADTFRRICDYACEIGIKNLTFYAFSTENWARPQNEVDAIMDLMRDYLSEAQERREENEEKGMRIRCIGDIDALAPDIIKLVKICEEGSRDKCRTTVNLAVNYGGRNEILNSVRKIASRVENGEVRAENITLDDISSGLYTADQPDPDLIIRPSGEYRLSNFMIWQAAYSEFWYSDVLWPDFTTDDLDRAILDFCRRSRRFGGI